MNKKWTVGWTIRWIDGCMDAIEYIHFTKTTYQEQHVDMWNDRKIALPPIQLKKISSDF